MRGGCEVPTFTQITSKSNRHSYRWNLGFGARSGDRTRTPLCRKRGILSPLCIPVSPSGRSRDFNDWRQFRAKSPKKSLKQGENWRRGPESNRPTWICNPVHNRFATAPRPQKRSAETKRGNRFPLFLKSGAGEESRTLDLNLGKVALYQLSYSRTA
jgi:hypothetical protein